MLYLFRGHEREWVNLLEDHSRGGRSIVDVYLDLLIEGRVGRLILVFPGISSDDFKIPGLLVDFKQPELARPSRGVGTGRFESYFVKELMTYVDGHFRTRPHRRYRGVDGFSLGGFQAVKLAAQYPGLFCSVGAYDGTFFYADRTGSRISPRDALFRAGLFDPAFGRPRDQDYAAANNPANLLLKADPPALQELFWMIQTGPEEAEPNDANFYRGRYITELLSEKGVPNRVPLVIPDGRHNWASADRHMAITLPLHWQVFMGQLPATWPASPAPAAVASPPAQPVAAEGPGPGLHLLLRPDTLAVCRLGRNQPLPGWVWSSNFLSITRTDDELSIVCAQEQVPPEVQASRDWACLEVEGRLDFNLVVMLAGAGVGLFVVSTYDTAYILVRAADLERALTALSAAGHRIRR